MIINLKFLRASESSPRSSRDSFRLYSRRVREINIYFYQTRANSAKKLLTRFLEVGIRFDKKIKNLNLQNRVEFLIELITQPFN